MIHLYHLGRVEVAYIKARKFITIRKHPTHIGHLAGVQVTQARDGLKIPHVVEPTIGSRRAGIGKRRVKDNPGHIGIGTVVLPTGIVGARVQVVGRACAAAALGVVVERERRVRRRVAGIGLSRNGEVARVARAAVDAGLETVHMGGIIGRALAAPDLGTIQEHFIGIEVGHGGCAPTAAGIDCYQLAAAREHVPHESYLRSVETAQVKTCQSAATSEHITHVSHIGRLPVAHIETLQGPAGVEHAFHIGHIGRVKMPQVEARQ